jgi:hypothetical protein
VILLDFAVDLGDAIMATIEERMAALEDGLDDVVQWKTGVDQELLYIRQRINGVQVESLDELERIYGITPLPSSSDDDRMDEIAKVSAQLDFSDETPETEEDEEALNKIEEALNKLYGLV